MKDKLSAYIELTERYERTVPPTEYMGDAALYAEIQAVDPVIQRILRAIDAKLAEEFGERSMTGYYAERAAARGAIGLIDAFDDLQTKLAPDSPVMRADQLHHWVWDAARTFWESQHYRAAVHAAATAINAHTQTKLGRRDAADDKLMQEAFSASDPSPGKARLRFPGDPTDPTVQSRQRGALQLALASFFMLRNPAAHETSEWTEQVALEALAVLSMVARAVDESQLVTQPSSPRL